jgi:hypothetical protein
MGTVLILTLAQQHRALVELLQAVRPRALVLAKTSLVVDVNSRSGGAAARSRNEGSLHVALPHSCSIPLARLKMIEHSELSSPARHIVQY